MEGIPWLGRSLLTVGLVLVLIGALLTWGPRLPWLGRLPGDFVLGGKDWRIYLPLGTSLLLSVALTLVLWIIRLLFRR
jgi:hypothetical protein